MYRRAGAASALLLCIILLALAAGCGESTEKTSTTPVVTTPKSADTSVTLYMLKGEVLTPVARQVAGSDRTAERALNELLKGPAAYEQQQGLTTAIPAGTGLNSFSVEDGIAKADFSGELAQYGGGSARVQAIMDQLSRTVMVNDPSVTTVQITVNGVPAEEALQP